MSLDHCRDLVARGDPDRHSVARAASDAAQARLYPLYALNLEIARAAWASAEPLVCEMRLQWWRDALADLGQGTMRPHPVLAACGFLSGDLTATTRLDAMIEARRWDIWQEPFADEAALWAHLAATGGVLMGVAAQALGADPAGTATAADFGTATALASWLQAAPELEARGRFPLPDRRPEAVARLAQDGLARISAARANRRTVPNTALPALLTGWRGPGLLALAAREPGRVGRGLLTLPEFSTRATLALRALSGRW